MSDKRIALASAAFLDSSQAKLLFAPETAEIRRVVNAFLGVCFEDLGKEPRLLDGQDMHAALGHLLPGRLKRKDPVAEHVPAILEAFLEHVEETETLPQAFEVRHGMNSAVEEFQQAVQTGENVAHRAPAQKPFVHRAEKLSRNDPCSCGSGKKYKKCHGKGS